jgi:hypothetical protein
LSEIGRGKVWENERRKKGIVKREIREEAERRTGGHVRADFLNGEERGLEGDWVGDPVGVGGDGEMVRVFGNEGVVGLEWWGEE